MARSREIDRDSPLPIFYQLAQRLRSRLSDGGYRKGDRFLTVREVVGQYGVSFVTAQRALASLAEQNLVSSYPGRGTRVLEARGGARRTAPITRTKRLLVLWPTHQPTSPLLHASVSSILEGLRAGLPGHSVSIEFPDESLLTEQAEQFLGEIVDSRAYSAYALLMAPPRVKQFFADRRVPSVVLGDVEPGIQLSSVSSAEEKAHVALTQHLLRAGHERIAQVIGTPRVVGHDHRLRGHRKALNQAGLKAIAARRDLEVTVPFDRERALAHVRRLLMAPEPPTAVVCAGSLMAGWLREGLGRDVHIAYDVNSETHEYFHAGATVMIWPGYEFGYTSGRILLEQMEGRRTVQTCVLDPVAIRDC